MEQPGRNGPQAPAMAGACVLGVILADPATPLVAHEGPHRVVEADGAASRSEPPTLPRDTLFAGRVPLPAGEGPFVQVSPWRSSVSNSATPGDDPRIN